MPVENKQYTCTNCQTSYPTEGDATICEKGCAILALAAYRTRAVLVETQKLIIQDLQKLIKNYLLSNNLTLVSVIIKPSSGPKNSVDMIDIFWPGKEIPPEDKVYWTMLQKMFMECSSYESCIRTEFTLYSAMTMLFAFEETFAAIHPVMPQSPPGVVEIADQPSLDV